MVNPGQVSSSSQDVTNIFKEKQVSFYHDCVITIPHDDKTDFRLEFQVNHVSFHLYPCIVVWQFDTREKKKVLYISVQNYHRNKKYSCFWRKHSFLLTGCHSQWPDSCQGEMKGRWWWPPHNWLWGFHHALSFSYALRTPGRSHGSRRPGCIHMYQGTDTHLHQTSWSALCPMCCRCCWHGCELQKILECIKKFVTNALNHWHYRQCYSLLIYLYS